MISDEAVEAAIVAYYAAIDADKGGVKDDMRAALEAAAPYIATAAWDEGEQAGVLNLAGEECPGSESIPNPYRSQT